MGIFDADPINPGNTLPGALALDGLPTFAGNNIIPVATSLNNGVLSAGDKANLNTSSALFSDLIIFVDPVNGNDANPGTQSLPFQTVDKALSVQVSYNVGLLKVFLAPGIFNFTKNTYNFGGASGSASASIVFIGGVTSLFGTRTNTVADPTRLTFTDGALGIRNGAAGAVVAGAPAGQMRLTGVPGYTATDIGSQFTISGSINKGNNGTFQIANVNVVANSVDLINAQAVIPDAGPLSWQDSFEGAFVECLTGANAGQRGSIKSNTLTSFTLLTPMTAAVGIGDTFAIEKPTVIFQASPAPGATIYFNGNGGNIGFIGIKKQGIFNTVNGQFNYDTCEWDLQGGAFLAQNAAIGTTFNSSMIPLQSNDPNNPFTPGGNVNAHFGAGLFLHNGNFQVGAKCQVTLVGVLRSVLFTQTNCIATFIVDAARTTHAISRNSNAAWQTSRYNGQLTNSSTGAILSITRSTAGIQGAGTTLDVSNSGGDAIFISQQANGGFQSTTGTGSVGAGIHVDRSGYCATNNATAVTGTLGNTAFGHPTVPNVQTYATINTPDANGVKGFQDIYGNRIEQ